MSTIVGKGGAMEKKIILRMKTPQEVRRTIQRAANMVINGELETRQANTIIAAGNAILNSIRTDDQQKKLDKLEQLIDELQQSRRA